jgi:NagD protein
MDGVIVRGSELIPGADAFIERLHQRQIKFLILTNNPMYTPVDLQHRLVRLGVQVTPDHIYTSALATSAFLQGQKPNGTAFVLGESGLTEAMHQVGYVLTEHQPDYVVYLGEHSENAIMVGDRMDTDVRVGTESGMETALVLTGVTTRDMVDRFPYRPTRIVNSVADLEWP